MDWIENRAGGLRDRLREVYGIKGRSLDDALRRAGRLLPRHIRREARKIVQAQAMLGNGRLEKTIDGDAVRKACADLDAHLDGVDVADLRRGRLLGLAGVLAFNLILIAAGYTVWLVSSGHI